MNVQGHVLLGTDAFFDDAGNNNRVLIREQIVLADIQDVQAGVSGEAMQNSESAKAADGIVRDVQDLQCLVLCDEIDCKPYAGAS